MQVSVETLSDLERRVTVQVPAERLNKDIQNRLQSLSQRVKVDGFRPGKVPFKLIKRLYGDQVRYEAVSELLKESLFEALSQQKLNPLGSPKIETDHVGEGEDFTYSATFEVLPEFELTGFETIKVERPVADVSDQDVDKMVLNLREQRATWNAVERPARETDRLRIDFDGQIDGEAFPGGQGENVSVILGKNALLKDFEAQLTGLKAGDDTEFDLTFPQDYQAQEVAGKTAHFRVKVHAVEEVNLPEVDDAFAESFDVKEQGVAGLKQSLRKNMERELQESIKASVKRQVMQGLLEANPISLPKVLIENEIENLASQLRFPLDRQDDEKNKELKTKLFEAEARRRVALGLLISRLASAQAIKPDEQRVRTYLETMASTYEDPSEVLRWYENTPQALENVRALALEDGVVDWLLERAQSVDKASTFADVMASARQ